MTTLASEPAVIGSTHSTTPLSSQPHKVPPHLVHKDTETEVLLHDWRQDTHDNSFAATAEWPTAHRFYEPAIGLHDPMLFVESVRQAIPLVSHAGYDVPVGNRQSWSSFRCGLSPVSLREGPGRTVVDLRLSCVHPVLRRGRLASATLRVDASREGGHLGWAETLYHDHTPAVYRRLRGEHADLATARERALPLPEPVHPEAVGRTASRDVVLAPGDTDGRWRLRVDLSHPVLFDHPVDHAPGMLLLEAARQAVHLTLGPVPLLVTHMEAAFARYVEFDTPCWIEARRVDTGVPSYAQVHVRARQNDEVAFSATLTAQTLLPL